MGAIEDDMNSPQGLPTRLVDLVRGERLATKPLIINCAHVAYRGAFFEPHTEDALRWMHFSATDALNVPGLGHNGNLRRFAACFRAARAARTFKADLVMTHDPRISFAVQHFLSLQGYHGPHLASLFNYPWLPTGMKRAFHGWGFRGIDKFVVYSTIERELYHEHFKIPLDRLEFMHLGVAQPSVDSPDKPLVEGDYVCALGSQSRDYRTLIDSARRLPEIRVVLVAKPENLTGFEIPSNVSVMTNIPYGHAMNVLAFSRFMALPLNSADVPCGHITLVNAMHLGKALAITRSAGVADYVREGDNALTFSAKSVYETAEVLRRLWYDKELCTRLGSAGRVFAARHCTEANVFMRFIQLLRQLGVSLPDQPDWFAPLIRVNHAFKASSESPSFR